MDSVDSIIALFLFSTSLESSKLDDSLSDLYNWMRIGDGFVDHQVKSSSSLCQKPIPGPYVFIGTYFRHSSVHLRQLLAATYPPFLHAVLYGI